MAKVLIVDDELSIRDTLSEFVREEDHEALVAEDADAALEILRERSPDLVVTDIILPRVTGVELLRRIHEDAPDVQVVMITGEPTAETAAEAVRLGAFDYLSKPILRDDFKSAVASALRVTELAKRKRELEAENVRYREHLEEEVAVKSAALLESEEKYRTVIDNAVEAVFVLQDNRIKFSNPSLVRLTGLTEESLQAMPFIEIVHPEDRAAALDRYMRRLRGEEFSDVFTFRMVAPDGEVHWAEIRGVRIEWEGKPATLNFAHEITERKRAEFALRESEERFRRLFEVSPFAMLYVDLQGNVIVCNESFTRMHATKGGPEQQIGRNVSDLVAEEDRPRLYATIEETVSAGKSLGMREFTLLQEDGTPFPAEVDSTPIRNRNGEPIGLVSMSIDISERRCAEDRERERQEQIQRSNEALLHLATRRTMQEASLESRLCEISKTAAEVLDIAKVCVGLFEDAVTENLGGVIYAQEGGCARGAQPVRPEDSPQFMEQLRLHRVLVVRDVSVDPIASEFDIDSLCAQGISSLLDAGVFVGGRLVGDVTFEHVGEPREWTHEEKEFASEVASLVALTVESNQRRQTEVALERREKEYHALFEDSPVSLWLEDYSQVRAWLAELEAAGVTDLRSHLEAHPAEIDRMIEAIRILDVNEAALSMHQGQTKADLLQGLERIMTENSRTSFVDQLVAVWEGETFYEGTAVDQTLTGEPRHVAIRWSVPPGYEETLERVLVATTDISAIVQAEQALREALTGTIEAIGLTTETRDPYTAGHQRRVTKLAVAIADEMALDRDRIEATRAAGLLHDIGKMAIPAEILSKPSALTDMEMALIQSHPRVAYDILESVKFPWPLAQIVLQHHERVDGSGYPQGLRSDDILIEARILAVADTVEAMASHRPYRAALGVDLALKEIEAKRGSHYDQEIVDACLRLFREGRFAFDSEDSAAV